MAYSPLTIPLLLRTVIRDILKIEQKYSTVPRAQERVSDRASERVSAAELASEASSAEQANECVVRVSKGKSEWPITDIPISRDSVSLWKRRKLVERYQSKKISGIHSPEYIMVLSNIIQRGQSDVGNCKPLKQNSCLEFNWDSCTE